MMLDVQVQCISLFLFPILIHIMVENGLGSEEIFTIEFVETNPSIGMRRLVERRKIERFTIIPGKFHTAYWNRFQIGVGR